MVAAIVCGMAACAAPSPKAASPGNARFVGTWEGNAAGREATLVVRPDQRASLTLRGASPKPTTLNGSCTPGADTLTFVDDAGASPRPAVYLFSTRPDGTLAATIDGVPMRLMRR